MICDTSVDEVLANSQVSSCDGLRYLSDAEAIIFLIKRGFWHGLRVCPDSNWDGCSDLLCPVPVDCPALLTVASKQTGWNHAVIWTGQEVYDPKEIEVKQLSDYEIKEWNVISKIGTHDNDTETA